MLPKLWSINAAATELGRDRRAIAKALAAVPPDGDVDKRTKGWRMETILSALNPPAAAGVLNLEEERARLAKEQADRLEMQNAVSRGGLLRREDVDAAVTGAFARVRARLLGVPAKVAPQAAAMREPAEIEGLVREAIYDALNELADTTVADLCGDHDDLVDDPPPAAAPERKRVGRPRKAAEP